MCILEKKRETDPFIVFTYQIVGTNHIIYNKKTLGACASRAYQSLCVGHIVLHLRSVYITTMSSAVKVSYSALQFCQLLHIQSQNPISIVLHTRRNPKMQRGRGVEKKMCHSSEESWTNKT